MFRNCMPEVFTLSGVVSGVGGPVAGFTVFYCFDGINTSVVTNEFGEYFIRIPACASVVITPGPLVGVTASPSRYVFNPVCDDMFRLDFTLTPVTPGGTVTLTGTVSGLIGAAGIVVNYTINGVPGTTTTDLLGRYSITAPVGSTVVITPVAPAGATLTPTTQTITNVTTDTTIPPFVVTRRLFVSGIVTRNGGLVSGVTLNYTVDGVPGVTTTDASGEYTILVPVGSDVTIMPVTTGQTSVPPFISLMDVVSDMPGQNFALSAATGFALVEGSLSGLTAVDGLPVSYTVNGGLTQTVMTNASGFYSFVVPLATAVVVTPPVQAGFTPTPPNVTIPNVTAPINTANFTYA